MKRTAAIFVMLLLMACTGMPAHAAEEREYSIQTIAPAEEPFPECGVLYKEVCTMELTSFSVSENGTVAVAGSHYVNVYDPEGIFVCGFYSHTSHSHLNVIMHDDWIEIYNTNGKYTAYSLDGTLLLCGYAEPDSSFRDSENSTQETGGIKYVRTYQKLIKDTGATTSVIYAMTNETHTLVFPEQAKPEKDEPHISFDRLPLSKETGYENLEVRLDGNDHYAPMKYAVNSAGEILLCAGDYLHMYSPEGHYERSLYQSSMPPVTFAFYTNCIQVYYERDKALVTYDRDGTVLDAVAVDSNSDAIRELKNRCHSVSSEEYGISLGRYLVKLASPQSGYIILYNRQDYINEDERYGAVHVSVILVLGIGCILGGTYKNRKDNE